MATGLGISPASSASWTISAISALMSSGYVPVGASNSGILFEKPSCGKMLIWVSLVYKSPQVDMGYDIADYRSIHPPYGTMQHVDALIRGLHDRQMKLVMDLVVNHTSDQV